jgi:hypothetical protein
MNDVFAAEDPQPRNAIGRRMWLTLQVQSKRVFAVRRDEPEEFAIINRQLPERSVAEARCLFQHRIEHRREVTWGGVDDAQNIRGCGLLL